MNQLRSLIYFDVSAGLGRIAGILSLEVEDQNASFDALQRVGSELAMHVVAAKPLFLTKELVSTDAIVNEREILKSQVLFFVIVLLFIGFCLWFKLICEIKWFLLGWQSVTPLHRSGLNI